MTNTLQTPTTGTINGFKFTLEPGRRYQAGREMDRRKTYTVSIRDISDGLNLDAKPVAEVTGLDYDGANALINGFNSDPKTGGNCRIW